MKVAILHDYLHEYAGSEKVLEEVLKIHPKAKIFTNFIVKENFSQSELISKAYKEGRVITSFEQYFLGSKEKMKWFKFLTWLHPITAKVLKVEGFDLVFVNTFYCSKYIRLKNNKKIISYIHAPAKFLYTSMSNETNFSSLGFLPKLLISISIPFLRWADQKATKKLVKRSQHVLTNSAHIQQEIFSIYGIKPEICYPPVDVLKYSKIIRSSELEQLFYLYYGRLVSYKRPLEAVEACVKLGRKIVVSGEGNDSVISSELKKYAVTYPDLVTVLGRVSFDYNAKLISQAKALLFPGKEDFGIIPVEVLSAGLPVIALNEGGAKEYVQSGVNGLLYDSVLPYETFVPLEHYGLEKAILEFERMELSTNVIKQSVTKFEKNELLNYL
jgi:glycosyltransferase involved in cell wall biosynthesis